jgi:hypothetical protein
MPIVKMDHVPIASTYRESSYSGTRTVAEQPGTTLAEAGNREQAVFAKDQALYREMIAN